MKLWTEFHATYLVGKFGTVSAAAEALGLHRATVSRHINALETHLGVKLFLRHAKGYTPTAQGLELMKSGQALEQQYDLMLARLRNREAALEGEIVVTSPAPLTALVLQVANAFQSENESCRVVHQTSEKLPELQLAEADVAIWAGERPELPDYVVVPIVEIPSGLFAHQSYVAAHGVPKTPAELVNHKLVLISEDTLSIPSQWLRREIGRDAFGDVNIGFRTNDRTAAFRAVLDGLGIGLLPSHIGFQADQVVPILPDLPIPSVPCWSVTHVDTHRSAKVQTFLKCLKTLGREALADQSQMGESVVAV
ncbi:MAG: LysR family transcriptional regulator [Pseudomonadota bacterium]